MKASYLTLVTKNNWFYIQEGDEFLSRDIEISQEIRIMRKNVRNKNIFRIKLRIFNGESKCAIKNKDSHLKFQFPPLDTTKMIGCTIDWCNRGINKYVVFLLSRGR